jgi:hypothetical protein
MSRLRRYEVIIASLFAVFALGLAVSPTHIHQNPSRYCGPTLPVAFGQVNPDVRFSGGTLEEASCKSEAGGRMAAFVGVSAVVIAVLWLIRYSQRSHQINEIVAGPKPPSSPPEGYHWDGERWWRWDGENWVPS